MKSPSFVILFFCVIAFSTGAQSPHESELNQLIEAEKSFAKMAKEKNTRDAFLFFMANDVVTASPGQGPIAGKKHLEAQPVNESLLSWRPLFSVISASGDFGYNTGPWEFSQRTTDKQPLAYGEFASMWKKNEHGEWKVVIDVGVSHPVPKKRPAVELPSVKQKEKSISAEPSSNVFEKERIFIEDLHRQGRAAYDGNLSPQAILLRAGDEPYASRQEVDKYLAHPAQKKITYTWIGGDVATSDDLAYVYGKASIETTVNGLPQATLHTYMRFWKKEGGDWKIVLDLISD